MLAVIAKSAASSQTSPAVAHGCTISLTMFETQHFVTYNVSPCVGKVETTEAVNQLAYVDHRSHASLYPVIMKPILEIVVSKKWAAHTVRLKIAANKPIEHAIILVSFMRDVKRWVPTKHRYWYQNLTVSQTSVHEEQFGYQQWSLVTTSYADRWLCLRIIDEYTINSHYTEHSRLYTRHAKNLLVP
jgi:hypothetical protein